MYDMITVIGMSVMNFDQKYEVLEYHLLWCSLKNTLTSWGNTRIVQDMVTNWRKATMKNWHFRFRLMGDSGFISFMARSKVSINDVWALMFVDRHPSYWPTSVPYKWMRKPDTAMQKRANAADTFHW